MTLLLDEALHAPDRPSASSGCGCWATASSTGAASSATTSRPGGSTRLHAWPRGRAPTARRARCSARQDDGPDVVRRARRQVRRVRRRRGRGGRRDHRDGHREPARAAQGLRAVAQDGQRAAGERADVARAWCRRARREASCSEGRRTGSRATASRSSASGPSPPTCRTALERVYRLDRVADVGGLRAAAPDEGEREALLLRESEDGALEMAVQPAGVCRTTPALDGLCQIIEGVSHFVYLVERARAQRTATQLELEMQAEVDKWLLLAAAMRRLRRGPERPAARAALRACHASPTTPASETGERYRVANDVAHGFVRRLERRYVARPALRRDARPSCGASSTRGRKRSCGSPAQLETWVCSASLAV